MILANKFTSPIGEQ